MGKSVWVLTREINQYNQDGEYFEAVYTEKPSAGDISFYLECSLAYAEYLLSTGGGRQGTEDDWYFLKEVVPIGSKPVKESTPLSTHSIYSGDLVVPEKPLEWLSWFHRHLLMLLPTYLQNEQVLVKLPRVIAELSKRETSERKSTGREIDQAELFAKLDEKFRDSKGSTVIIIYDSTSK